MMLKKCFMWVVMFPFLTLLYMAGVCVGVAVALLSLLAAPLIVWRLVDVWVDTKELQKHG